MTRHCIVFFSKLKVGISEKKGRGQRFSENTTTYTVIKDVVPNARIFLLFRTRSANIDHLIGEKTRTYFAKIFCISIMNSHSLLPKIANENVEQY